jgi:hypothetical protein
MTNIAETRVTETPTPFSFLPNVYDCVIGDYITYATRGEGPVTLGWGRLQEDSSQKLGRFFVQNELDDSMFRHYFFNEINLESKLAYRFPDEKMNLLLRELPSSSVKEMLGLHEERNKEDVTPRDIFGTPIQKGDLVTFVSTWKDMKLGQVAYTVRPTESTIRIQSVERSFASMSVAPNMMAVVPVSQETKMLIQTMDRDELKLHYLEMKRKVLSSAK